MPLDKSASKKVVGKNIEREESAGKPKKQAEAIALNTQRKAEGKKDWKGGKERSTSDGHMVINKKK